MFYKVYISWVNSILSDVGQEIEGISDIQDGKALCQVIDLLTGNMELLKAAQVCQNSHLEPTGGWRTPIVIYIVDSVTLQFSSNAFTLRHWLLKVYRICFHKTTEFESPSLVSMNLFGKLIRIALIGRFHYFQREVYQSKTNLL